MSEYPVRGLQFIFEFYATAVLPQFGIQNKEIVWGATKQLGPDEDAFYFSIDRVNYCLIFEDYFGLALDSNFIKETLGLSNSEYEYIYPTSYTSKPPSYQEFKLHPPSQHINLITGTFTLLKILSK